MSVDVAIIGGGVIGASIAYHLRRLGAACALIDPDPFPRAPSATWAGAGGVRSQRRDPREWPLTVRAAERWPALADELQADPRLTEIGVASVWRGMESESPDGVPYLGGLAELGALTGLYSAVGFSGHGFQIAPAVGEAMASLVTGGDAGGLLDGLEPARILAASTPDRTTHEAPVAWPNAG